MSDHPDESLEVLRHDLQRGEAEALDPVNAEAVEGGRAVTTLQSRWLHRLCPVCGHTFRPGDEVDVAPDGTVRHDGGLLPCAVGHDPDDDHSPARESAPAELADFFTGLHESWPPPDDLPVRRLEEGDSLLDPPIHGFRRHTCAVCAHTLRPLDHVIICPCSPDRPLCAVAIHRDLLRGLHCWSAWDPGAVRQHCPATSREVRERTV